jgi:hypothetical protein
MNKESFNDNLKNPEDTKNESHKEIRESVAMRTQGSLDFNESIKENYEGAHADEIAEMKEVKQSAASRIYELNQHIQNKIDTLWKESTEDSMEDPSIGFSKNSLKKNSEKAA